MNWYIQLLLYLIVFIAGRNWNFALKIGKEIMDYIQNNWKVKHG